jgi:hypothetical protein
MSEKIAFNLSYGFRCTKCRKGKMLHYATSELGKFVSVTYQCNRCFAIRDELYPKNKYQEGLSNAKRG